MKLIWKKSDPPFGRYRSSQKRQWPRAYYNSEDGKLAALLDCVDEYVPANVKINDHGLIKIFVLHYQHPEATEFGKLFILKNKAKTLDEAKDMAYKFLKKHPEWQPRENNNESNL